MRLSTEIKELLKRIQDWMIDNDYECGPEGAEIYSNIETLLGLGEQQNETLEKDLEDLEECEQCRESAWDGRICHSCGMKNI